MRVRNLREGSRQPTCGCKSWLDHWENNSGRKAGTCSASGCSEKATDGGHVQKVGVNDDSWYIIPLCRACNLQYGAEYDDIVLVKYEGYMRKLSFLGLILALGFIFTGCGGNGSPLDDPIDDNTPLNYYSVSIPTAQEEAEYFLRTLKQYKWFMNNGYTHVTIPSHPVLDPLKTKILNDQTLTSTEEVQVINTFKADLFNQVDYQQSFPAIRRAAVIADRQIDSLRRYQTAWGFYIPDRYKIQLTVYGPGGSYHPATGTITMTVPKDGQFTGNRKPIHTILHETIHIGIEDRIIQRYKIGQQDKELIVDYFTKNHFSAVIPDYPVQGFNAPTMDMMFKNTDVLDDLPQRIEEILASVLAFAMQEGTDKAASAATDKTPTKFEGYWSNTASSLTAYAFQGNGFAQYFQGNLHSYGTFIFTETDINFTHANGSTWVQPYQLQTNLLYLEQVPGNNFGQFVKK